MRVEKRFFYGYWIVLVGFITNFLCSGLGYYGFSVFNKPIGDEFGWSRSAVTAGFLCYSAAIAASSPIVGRLTDKHGPRKILLLGAVALSVALMLLSLISAIWNFYVLHVFFGITAAFFGAIPVNVKISNWFSRLRGTMQGLALTGRGFGGLTLAPLLGNYLIPSLSWRGAYLAMAPLLLVIMLPLLCFVVKDHPQQKGLRPYGQEPSQALLNPGSDTEEATGFSFREALRIPAFWFIVSTFFAYGMSMTGTIQNQVSILSGWGFTTTEAVTAIGVIGLCSGAGKFLFGFLCDRTDPKYAAGLSYTLVAVALIALIQAHSMTYVWLYAVLVGLGSGGWAPNLAMLAATYFGLRHYGTLLGAMHLAFLTGEAVGPVLAGFVYDQTGSYRLILVVFVGLCAVSVPLIATVKRPSINV
jgi:MFS family permease